MILWNPAHSRRLRRRRDYGTGYAVFWGDGGQDPQGEGSHPFRPQPHRLPAHRRRFHIAGKRALRPSVGRKKCAAQSPARGCRHWRGSWQGPVFSAKPPESPPVLREDMQEKAFEKRGAKMTKNRNSYLLFLWFVVKYRQETIYGSQLWDWINF